MPTFDLPSILEQISRNARLSEEYGTRHHAGMALAERPDTLFIAVSEERGRISIFKGGDPQSGQLRCGIFAI